MTTFRNIFSQNRSADQKQPFDMYPTPIGPGKGCSYELSSYSSREIRWDSLQSDTQGAPLYSRTPEPHHTIFPYPGTFCLAGKTYTGLDQLCAQSIGEDLWLDIYGRTVMTLSQRFPCFDSYDLINEDRYYRWFLLPEKDRLHRVFYEDGRRRIYVTEDVCFLENCCLQPVTARYQAK